MMMCTNTTLKHGAPRRPTPRPTTLAIALTLLAGTGVAAGGVQTAVAVSQRPHALGTVRYRVSSPAPQTHYLEVEASVPTDRKPEIELTMPVWTPGSYLVREYARNVEGVAARGPAGQPLAIDKTR